MKYNVVLVTASSAEEGERIANVLLENKLIACCNMISGVKSMYWWQGQIVKDSEVLLVIKSQAVMFDKIKETVLALHSYTVPEVIALPVQAGSEAYLKWIDLTVSA